MHGVKASEQAIASGFERALPNHLDIPSGRAESGLILPIARDVGVKFSVPKFDV
jgi:hypothetical protein